MTKTTLTPRDVLLAKLEAIIGDSCYNGNIQNYGPNGRFEGEGRSFRYPLTVIDSDGKKHKKRSAATDISQEELSTGYYAFGANRLHIIKALDDVLKHLEENNDLKI